MKARVALEEAKRFTSVRGRGVPLEYERVMSKARTGLEHNPESDSISDAVASTATIVGDEAQCLEHLRTILNLEPRDVIFRLLTGGRMQRLETLAGLMSHI